MANLNINIQPVIIINSQNIFIKRYVDDYYDNHDDDIIEKKSRNKKNEKINNILADLENEVFRS